MPLVDYSSSSEGEQNDSNAPGPPAKRRRTAANGALPPLPDAFHDLYASQVRISTSDDPALHEGRKRAVPHVEGNWPTHMYIEWHPSEAQVVILESLIEALQAQRGDIDVRSHLRSDVGTILPLHISLSAPLVLRAEQKDDFLASVKRELHQGKNAPIKTFEIQFDGMRWVSNEASSRWFRVLQARRRTGDELNRLLQASNAAANEYNLPQLYDRPSTKNEETNDRTECFHVSFAWSLDDPIPVGATQSDEQSSSQHLDHLRLNCNAIKVKIGNVVNSISLSSHYQSHKGILG